MTQNSRFPLNFPPPCVIFTFIKSTCIRYEYYIPVHVEMKQRAYKVVALGDNFKDMWLFYSKSQVITLVSNNSWYSTLLLMTNVN